MAAERRKENNGHRKVYEWTSLQDEKNVKDG